ncbi:MAG: PepSY domain-containing protein [Rhodospirillales bacterium]
MKRTSQIALAGAIVIAIGGVGAAASARETDPPSMANAGIGMVQAVTVAEHHVNGKAARAEFEKSKGQWVYDVEVVSGTKVYDVKVDPAKGSVISSAEDKADADDNDAED